MTRTALILLVLGAFALAACGRAGSPLTPYQAAVKQAKENKEPIPEAPVPNSKNEDKRFILDGLLE